MKLLLAILLYAPLSVWACTLTWDAPSIDDEVDGIRLLVKDEGTTIAQPDMPADTVTVNCDAYLGKSVAVAFFNQFDQGESTRFIFLGAPGKPQNYRVNP